jgi:tetratricopeptide (TPR) repeat protein
VAVIVASYMALVLLALGCILFQQRRRARKLDRAIKIVHAAYCQGDYQKGLQLAEGLKRGRSKTAAYWFFRGKMLYQLGQLSESESCLRAGLALDSEPNLKALALEDLGRVQLEQQRYEEAIRNFEASSQDVPGRASGHRAIAETWLRQGIREADASSYALLAVENARSGPASKWQIQEFHLAEALATLAWAVAVRSAETAEVERLLADTFTLCGEEDKPVLAHLHFLAGSAYSALATMDARERSAYHFQEAADADPDGNFGRLAKAAVRGAAA